MSEKVHCKIHGDKEPTFVCTHLVGESVGLGFNCEEPSATNPFPDAWCDDCEIIYRANNGWTEESQELVKISLLCSGCYERTHIRNTKPIMTLDDLTGLRWKCGSCEDWHTGPCLDIGYSSPHHWATRYAKANRQAWLLPSGDKAHTGTFLDQDYCAIEDIDFFVRGVIHLPIIGTAESFRWGVWGSLSRSNFETLLRMDEESKRSDIPAMFSWMSTEIREYPDTLNLKMYAHVQEAGQRPRFELEKSDHPLSQEYHTGILPQRVKEIMLERLHTG